MENSVILVDYLSGRETSYNPDQFNKIPDVGEMIIVDDIPCKVMEVVHDPDDYQTRIKYTRK